jgi:hypothetical protein
MPAISGQPYCWSALHRTDHGNVAFGTRRSEWAPAAKDIDEVTFTLCEHFLVKYAEVSKSPEQTRTFAEREMNTPQTCIRTNVQNARAELAHEHCMFSRVMWEPNRYVQKETTTYSVES